MEGGLISGPIQWLECGRLRLSVLAGGTMCHLISNFLYVDC